ncbi:Ig-like domain-containing protein [Parapedobacter indicus]|uniref:Gliding motility-associated C-terminal domain-containing protein n=1 Tax=Parapedobacter indicus TaxID=1477437 RepID=A0A1I3S1Q2_9SPHI|nr:Ig-like domain-containing protein [Parapedobacter indicus]PPK99905.1 gliding motility-associated-like protein [Parapedobacter indicus]SFJ52270.1 gliding motility-associated C-terminal domain-containing protein [Parapedobacter indicus]
MQLSTRLKTAVCCLAALLFAINISLIAQTTVTFDDQGYVHNASLGRSITIGNFEFSVVAQDLTMPEFDVDIFYESASAGNGFGGSGLIYVGDQFDFDDPYYFIVKTVDGTNRSFQSAYIYDYVSNPLTVDLTVEAYRDGTLLGTQDVDITSVKNAYTLGALFGSVDEIRFRQKTPLAYPGLSGVVFAFDHFIIGPPANELPTDITLTPYPVSINQSAGANVTVGTLASTDPDAGDTHIYTLVSGAGSTNNGSFNISGNSLRASNPSTLSAGSNSVRIQTDDQNGGTFPKVFTITVIDDVAPTVNSVSVPTNATYVAGQNLDFTVNVSENVTVTGAPQLPLTIGTASVNAIYNAGGSNATALLFRYTIQAGDVDTDGIALGTSINLNSGTISDGASLGLILGLNNVGNTTGVFVDGVAPSVTSVDVPANDTYGIGEPLNFTVNFDEAVTVNTGGGSPRFPLTIGTDTRYATYQSGSGTSALEFTYTVGAGDNDINGIVVGTAIELNGSTLQDAAGNSAALILNAIGNTNGILVDGVAPTVSAFSPANGSSDMEPSDNLLITFSEAVALGTGNIVIYDDLATPITTIDVESSGGQLSIADDVLTINPTADLLELTDYYVHIGNDAIHDLVGNVYAGINNNTTWAFTVADMTAPSGYDVTIDQATITLANHTALSFTFSGAEVGATFDYEITSNNGGTPVTGNGNVIAAGEQVSGIDVSGLANGTLTLSVTLTDASNNEGNPATDNVTKAVSYPPTITTSGGTTTFTESVSGSPVPVLIDDALTISDPDNTTLASATVAITGNFQSDQDVLAFENDGSTMGNIDGNYSAGTLTLTSPGATATLAQWQAALRAVTYSNTSSTPNTANRTISFVVNDGLDDSTPGTKTVAVQAVNNAPVITNLDGDAVTFTEDGPAILLDAGGNATVSDSDSPDFDGGNLTVSVIAGGVGSEDMLAIRNEGMGTGQIGASNDNDVYYGGVHIGSANGGMGGADLILTFLPTATPAAVQALIRNLTYSNSNIANPSVDPRTVRVTLNDGDGATSAPSDLIVNITAVNDAPMVITSGGAVTFTEPEDGDPVPEAVDPGLTVTDPDNATLASATISITSGSFQAGEDMLAFENDGSTMGNIDGSYDEATGTLMLTSLGGIATLAEWQAALRAVAYSNNSQHPNTTTRTVSFEVNDGTADSAPATKDINVVAVNTAPVAVDDPVMVNEDIPATGNALTNDSDVEGNALTASLVTAPVNGTVVLNADGSFTYTPNSNYNGLDSLEYQVCDNGTPSLCDTAWVRFTIGAINDAPVITAPATLAADEDVLTDLTGISFADVDASSADVTVTFSVGSGTLAATSGGGVTVSGSETAALTLVGSITDLNAFIAAGNVGFTTVLDETDDVTLTVHIDDGGNTGTDPGNSGTDDSEAATTTVTITVTAQNDAPINTVPGSQTIDQDQSLVFSTANGNAISVADVDAGGGTIQVTLTASNGLLALAGTTGLTFAVGSGAGDATMTFSGTITDINVALDGLTLMPTSGYSGAASLQIVTNDLGLTGAGGNQTDTDVVDITVNEINPEVSSVNTTSTDGVYKMTDIITLTISFDQAVIVDETAGSPTLLLETGSTDREAGYESGSGSNTLVFTYMVQAGDVNADLDYQSTAALTLNGATIQSASGSDAILTLPAIGGAGSIAGQHAIVIDGVAPVVTAVDVPADGTYRNGDVLSFTVHYSEDIAVVGGMLTLPVTIGTTTVQASLTDTTRNTLIFSYAVQDGELDTDGIGIGPDVLLNGGALQDDAGNDASLVLVGAGNTSGVLIDAVAPVVTSVSVPANGYHREGDVLTFTVHMSEDVAVNDAAGTPYLDVMIGTATVQATYTAGSGTAMLAFSYTVQAEDEDLDGIALGRDIVLDGGTLHDNAGNEAALILEGVAPMDRVFVYSRRPSVALSIEAESPVNAPFTVTATFSEAVTGFTLDDITVTNGTLSDLQTSGNSSYTFLVTPTVGGSVQLSVAADVAVNIANNGNDVSNTLSVQFNEIITGITLEDESFVYDGTAKSLAITGDLPPGTSVSYTNNSRTGAGTQEVTATVSGDNYEDLVLTAALTVTAATRSIEFPAIPAKTYGDADFNVGATASTGEEVSYTSSDMGVAEIVNGQLHITGAGTTTITATVPENSNYGNRPEATQVLTVRKAAQTITFDAPVEVYRDAGDITLDVIASSGLPVALMLDDPEVAVLNGSTLDILRLGTVRITAVQEGDANYESADPVTVTIRVIDPASNMPVRIHKAVSPNGDGINEYLIIEAIKDYPENRVTIFNRNGTIVWEANGYNNGSTAFSGIGTGQLRVASGTYFYVAEIKVDGKWKYEKGWFVLRY